MMRSRALHLLISILFLLQTTVPVSVLGAGSAANTVDAEVPEEIVQSLLDGLELQNELLAGLSVDMTAVLDEIRATYPQQFSLWEKIFLLPSSAFANHELEKDIGITRAVLVSVTSYAQHLSSLQTQYSEKSTASRIDGQPAVRQASDNALLSTVLPVQEKIRAYELFSQGKINEINTRIKIVYALDSFPEIVTEMDRLERQRSRLLRDYTKLLAKYESVKSGTDTYREYNNAGFNHMFKEELSYYSDLAQLLDSETKTVKKQFRDELLNIAQSKIQDLQATLSILTAGKDGRSWPLFQNVSSEKSISPDAENKVLNDLRRALERMRPKLTVLRDILTARNKLLFQSDFLTSEDGGWLRYQVGLEDFSLGKVSDTLEQLSKLDKKNPSDIDQHEAVLLEELGLAKEDILAIETIILDELLLQNKDGALSQTSEGREILRILAVQKDWQQEWQQEIAEFDRIVASFKGYQVDLLENTLKTTAILRADVQRVSKRLALKKSQAPFSSFLSLLDRQLSAQLIQTQQKLDTRIATIAREGEDPLFYYVFGNRPDRFWHDYRSMGLAFDGFERLQNNKSRIRADLLALSSPAIAPDRQIQLVLRLILQCNIGSQISCSEDNCSVVVDSGAERFIIENLGENGTSTLQYFSETKSDTRALSILQNLLSALRIVSPAQAGFLASYSKWGNNVLNQMKKNVLGYAVTGVVIAGALVAAPVVAAAGAATATVAAVTTGAAAVASAGATAFYAQASADVALGTSRFAVNEMTFEGNQYATKKNWNTVLDVVETSYNVTKLADGIRSVVSRPDKAVDANKYGLGSLSNKVAENTSKTAEQLALHLQTLENASEPGLRSAAQITEILRTKEQIVKLTRMGTDIGQRGATIVKNATESAASINSLTAATRIASQIADGGGIPNSILGSVTGLNDLIKDKEDGGSDAIPDICQANPNKKLPGKCGCNEPDTDSDNDGTPDCLDDCDDNPKLTKEGKCGCDDEVDADGDGVPSCNGTLDLCDDNPKLTKEGKCGCDDEIDADGDGVPSCNGTLDLCDDNPKLTKEGKCDCDDEVDADGDGVPSCNKTLDICDDDPLKTEPGICGCKVADIDEDKNGIMDCDEKAIDDDQVVDDLRNAENQGGDSTSQENTANNTNSNSNVPITIPGSSGWQPSATGVTANERANSANAANAANQIKNNAQNQAAAYQAAQSANQSQTAESLNQIDRERSTQLLDAAVGGLTSGIAQGVGTFGERVGQGAGVKVSQSITGNKHNSGGEKHNPDGQQQCDTDADCPAGTTCDQGTKTCTKQEGSAATYSGSWGGSITCTANFGKGGSGSCPYKGSMQLVFTPSGSVSGTSTGGYEIFFKEDGSFDGCGSFGGSTGISGSHSNGSFSATSGSGTSLSGSYTEGSATGTLSGGGTITLSKGGTASCTKSASVSLSR